MTSVLRYSDGECIEDSDLWMLECAMNMSTPFREMQESEKNERAAGGGKFRPISPHSVLAPSSAPECLEQIQSAAEDRFTRALLFSRNSRSSLNVPSLGDIGKTIPLDESAPSLVIQVLSMHPIFGSVHSIQNDFLMVDFKQGWIYDKNVDLIAWELWDSEFSTDADEVDASVESIFVLLDRQKIQDDVDLLNSKSSKHEKRVNVIIFLRDVWKYACGVVPSLRETL
jgi:hypothetical protein